MTNAGNIQELLGKAHSTKLDLINHLPEIQSAIEFGGVWNVDMVYLRYAMQKATAIGIEVDNLHPANMQDNIMYVQGDFRDDDVLEKIPKCDLVILYDIILHQVDAFNAFNSLVSKSKKYVVFHQPMFDPPNQALPNSMFYLPGNDLAKYGVDVEKLISFKVENPEDFGPQGITNPNKWHWGMSLDLVRTWFRFLGYKIIFETEPEEQMGWLWKDWVRWGCVAERI